MARFAEKHENELRTMVEDGKTLPEIAEHFKVSYATASTGLKEFGLKAARSAWGTKTNKVPAAASASKPGPDTKISKEDLIRMYVDEDMTVGEIASKTGVTRQTVYNTMARYGVPRQKKSRVRRMFDEQQVRSLMDYYRSCRATRCSRKFSAHLSQRERYSNPQLPLCLCIDCREPAAVVHRRKPIANGDCRATGLQLQHRLPCLQEVWSGKDPQANPRHDGSHDE